MFSQEMGFTRAQAEAAMKKYGTVQAALDSLLAGVGRYLLTREKLNCFCLKSTDRFKFVM